MYATPHYGGVNAATDENGQAPWIIVQRGAFTGKETFTRKNTEIKIYYSGVEITKTIALTMHTENVTITPLPEVLLLLSLQQVVMSLRFSPAVLAAVVAFVVVTVIYYRLRRT